MNAKVMTAMMSGLCAAGLLMSTQAFAFDADEAQALAKKEGCLKCHAVDKKKEAKSLTEISKSLKGKADAEAKLLHHLTSGEKVKFEDGKEEEHKVIKTKDKVAIKNLTDWILSLGK
ncbi:MULTISPECIES: c-type cytochrome [Zoogloea]|jgi:cytochrome c|uniref:C-type cytochrome n=1 Tax=Zoogloea oleivorans TaxID=1552750 RepID=A0A6C2CM27_9RHOO|nr:MULTISPECIES: c-type cytochrome [Zoogloea]MBT9497028.1 c-type cytochrome [Zoogloea sp.]MDD2669661.1 c-type cytochrome [Zoogloea sp.]MDY0038363.1 c-type cytochrome [Zoogloea oleivorans]TYC54399.1 c-type cytochrome [Zoogloea oleivorans]